MGATRRAIAQQAHLDFGNALMSLEGLGVGEFCSLHTLQHQRERVRSDQVRGH
jgi:hypothetical protein